MLDRTLFLYGNISSETVSPILEAIIRINKEDEQLKLEWEKTYVGNSYTKQPIHLHINSGGGIMYDCFSLLSAMKSSKTPIHTYCHGYAMSSGLTLFMAGDRRFAGSFATFMAHQPTEELGNDKLFVMENRLEETKRLKNIRTKFICERSKLTEDDFEKNKYIDWFMSAEEAMKYGIVDQII